MEPPSLHQSPNTVNTIYHICKSNVTKLKMLNDRQKADFDELCAP